MLGSKSTLQWVSSPNGPFILFPRGAKAEPVTNIEMGGDVLQGVQLGESSCVLLADGFETTWWNLPAWGGGIIVRCLWADSEDAVVHAVQNVEESDWSEENVVLDALDGALILSDLSGKSRDELEVFVSPGQYRISTANVKPDENTCVILHRLLPVT